MHYYTFHPAKHKLETFMLKPLERLAYRELLDIYYDGEKPLTTDIEQLTWRMNYETDELKQALQFVLDKFFVIKKLKGDTEPMYHHTRLDAELADYKFTNSTKNKNKNTNTTAKNTNESANDTNDFANADDLNTSDWQKRKNMVEALKNQGIKANARMKIADLQMLFDTHCKSTNATAKTTNESTNDTNAICPPKNKEPLTNNQEQETNNISPLTPQGEASEQETEHDNQKTFDENLQSPPTQSQTNAVTSSPSKSKYTNEIAIIFAFWKQTFNKDENKTKLSDVRKRKIIQRLEQGYTVDDIKTAIVNCSKSEYHITGGHTDIELICRDEQHIDRFLAMKPKKATKATLPTTSSVNQQWQQSHSSQFDSNGNLIPTKQGVSQW